MKKFKYRILFLILCVFGIGAFSQINSEDVWVEGYYKRDGTYVEGHYRTAPNSTNRDNYSTKGNYNPYTGKAGWVCPDNILNESDVYPKHDISLYQYRTIDFYNLEQYLELALVNEAPKYKIHDKMAVNLFNNEKWLLIEGDFINGKIKSVERYFNTKLINETLKIIHLAFYNEISYQKFVQILKSFNIKGVVLVLEAGRKDYFSFDMLLSSPC